jgi:general stress protein YciG
MADDNKGKSERGFASMSEEERREIARKGGESVPDEKRSFSQDRELASEAGKKGGESRGNDK